MIGKPVLNHSKSKNFVFLFNPPYDNHIELKTLFWIFLLAMALKVMQALTDSTYIVRQIGTHKTQCVHRVRLPPFVPQGEIEDNRVNQKDLYILTQRQ